MPVNRITKFTFNGDLDFRNKVMSLDTAKHILAHLSAVTGKTIQFSNDMWALIEDDDEAIEILEEVYSRGWNSNEPDIIVVAESGYDGKVHYNDSEQTLTQSEINPNLWFKSNAGSITSLDCFSGMSSTDSSTYYNSTAIKIQKVRFGNNIDTSVCTTFRRLFRGSGMTTNIEKLDVRHLNTSSGTNFNACFGELKNAAGTLIDILGIGEWDVSHATTVSYMMYQTYVKFADLHKWHIPSGCAIEYLFPTLQFCATNGINSKFYYTPGYWAVNPMGGALGQNVTAPTVYPYHDITMAVDNASSQTIMVNESSVTAAYDSTLGIAYYDSSVPVTSLTDCVRTNTHIVSISLSKNMQIGSETVGLYRPFEQCTSLRTVNWEIETSPGGYNTLFDRCTALTNIYGFDKFEERTFGALFRTFYNTKLRYAALPKMNFTNGIQYSFYACANLIRISNFPGLQNGINTNSAMYNCTSLTTIDAAGPISETIDFSPCPLNLDSAKVILSALQQVTSETLTFSSTTKGYINADSEALAIVASARSKGWNIPL